VDDAQLVQFHEGLREGAVVAQVSTRHHDPVGDLPVDCWRSSKRMAFCPSTRKALIEFRR
jgi:hypothetical protein